TQVEQYLCSVREFVGDSPADSRGMYTDFLSYVIDHHRLQIIDALIEKFRLAPDNRFTNLDDNMLALLKMLQKLHCLFKTVHDVILHFLVQSIPLEHMAIGRA